MLLLVPVPSRPVQCGAKLIWGFPKIRGSFFGGPNNKDYSILGSILGFHYFGKLSYTTRVEGSGFRA